jgi:hypothetical protein
MANSFQDISETIKEDRHTVTRTQAQASYNKDSGKVNFSRMEVIRILPPYG